MSSLITYYPNEGGPPLTIKVVVTPQLQALADEIARLRAEVADLETDASHLQCGLVEANEENERLRAAGRNLVDAWFGDENIEPLIHKLRDALK